jgi:hypothetical protein
MLRCRCRRRILSPRNRDMQEGVAGETERERVEKWRERELVRAGFDEDVAWLLSTHHDVDLHEAIGLLRGGCDQTVAMLILL